MKSLLLWPKMWSLKDGDIFFRRESDSKCKIVYRPRIRRFWNFSPSLSLIFSILLTFLMCWIGFVIYFHFKILTSALCSNTAFSNASLCLISCYIEVFAVRDLTWVVRTWMVFTAAVWEYLGQSTSCKHWYWLGWNSHLASASIFF